MPFIRVLKEALSSIFANKTRSFLTVLGIVIGVGAVIGMLAIGAGAQASILGEIESIGTNTIYVMRGGSDEITNPKPLTISDAEALANRTRAPHIIRVTPVMMTQANFSLADVSLSTSIFGSYADYAQISAIEIEEGAFLSNEDIDSRASVVV